MRIPFDSRQGLIVVRAELWGPTGSGIEFAPRVMLEKLVALGRIRPGFPVLGHTLPPSAGVDGLLGLDFLRGQSLTVDFRVGQVTLT